MTSSHSRRRLWLALAVIGAPVAAALAVAALRAAPPRVDATSLVAQAEDALAHGRFTTARLLARAAVAAVPQSGTAHLALARAAMGEGDGVTGEAEVARATTLGIRSDPALLGEARLLQGDTRRALALSAGRSALAMRIRARALAAAGQDATAAFDRAVAAHPNDAALWVDVARFARAADDTGKAVDAARRALAIDPDNADTLARVALVVRDRVGPVAALPWFERALSRDPASYALLIDYAATLGEAGRARDMLAAVRRALAVLPGDATALYQLSVLAARGGNIPLARDLLDRAGSGIETRPAVLLFGATLDLRNGDPEQAVAKLRNLLGLQPLNLRARQLLAMALLSRDAAQEALDVLQPIALRADADTYTLTLAARAFERVGNRDGAADLLDRARRAGGGTPAAFDTGDAPVASEAGDDPMRVVALARAMIVGGDMAGALVRVRALALARPGVPAAWLALGDTLLLSARAGEAAAAYSRAARLRFDEPTMSRLVEALERAGDRLRAAAVLARFLAQNPGNVAALRLSARAAPDPVTAVSILEGLRARLGNRDAALLADLATAYRAGGNADASRSFAAAAYRLLPAGPTDVAVDSRAP